MVAESVRYAASVEESSNVCPGFSHGPCHASVLYYEHFRVLHGHVELMLVRASSQPLTAYAGPDLSSESVAIVTLGHRYIYEVPSTVAGNLSTASPRYKKDQSSIWTAIG